MGTFLVLLEGKDPESLTEALLFGHIEFLKKLKMEDRLVTCGPLVNQDRALLIIRATSLLEAEALIKQDPFIKYQYYQGVVIQEFTEANEANNYLLGSAPSR